MLGNNCTLTTIVPLAELGTVVCRLAANATGQVVVVIRQISGDQDSSRIYQITLEDRDATTATYGAVGNQISSPTTITASTETFADLGDDSFRDAVLTITGGNVFGPPSWVFDIDVRPDNPRLLEATFDAADARVDKRKSRYQKAHKLQQSRRPIVQRIRHFY
jgi:hypothetical protein